MSSIRLNALVCEYIIMVSTYVIPSRLTDHSLTTVPHCTSLSHFFPSPPLPFITSLSLGRYKDGFFLLLQSNYHPLQLLNYSF